MSRLVLLLSVFSISILGCMQTVTITPNNSVPVKSVEIFLLAPTTVAFDRVMAAFISEGYRVDQANKEVGLIKSAGMFGDMVSLCCLVTGAMQSEYFFRANILPSEGGSKVFLSVSQRINMITTLEGTKTTSESELHECQKPDTHDGDDIFRKCQERIANIKGKLDNLALRIKP